MKTLAICCDQPVLSCGLELIVSQKFIVTGVFRSIQELMESFEKRTPDAVIVDANQFTGVEWLRNVARIAPGTRIVVWVDKTTTEFVSQCLSSGVAGLLPKCASTDEHLRCLAEVAVGNVWIDKAFTATLLGTKQIPLTPRERQIMGLVVQGLTNKEVAWALHITEGTVKVYLSKLFDKVGASDRFELALLGLKNLAASAGSQDIPRPHHELPAVPCAFPASICIAANVHAPAYQRV